MTFVGNLLWFIFGGGLLMCIGWYLLGLLLMITIVGIPFSHAAFRIAGFTAFPFGKELVDARLLGKERIAGTGLANFIWIILAGLWLAISHALAGIVCFLSFPLVFPIFFGMAHFKLAGVSFAPLGKTPVSKELAVTALARNASLQLEDSWIKAKNGKETVRNQKNQQDDETVIKCERCGHLYKGNICNNCSNIISDTYGGRAEKKKAENQEHSYREHKNSNICNKCGLSNEDGNTFCNECGNKLTVIKKLSNASIEIKRKKKAENQEHSYREHKNSNICNKCGLSNEDGNTFCNECGHKIADSCKGAIDTGHKNGGKLISETQTKQKKSEEQEHIYKDPKKRKNENIQSKEELKLKCEKCGHSDFEYHLYKGNICNNCGSIITSANERVVDTGHKKREEPSTKTQTEQKNSEEQKHAIKEAEERNKIEDDKRKEIEDNKKRGKLYFKQKDYDKAIEEFENAIKIDSGNKECIFMLQLAKDNKKSVSALRKEGDVPNKY